MRWVRICSDFFDRATLSYHFPNKPFFFSTTSKPADSTNFMISFALRGVAFDSQNFVGIIGIYFPGLDVAFPHPEKA
jgi:hypothetical protein